jgi:MFS family permease
VPLGVVLRDHWAPTLAACAAVVSAFAIFYLSTAFALSHMTAARGVPRETMLALQLAANLFLALGIVFAAIGSDRTSPRRMLAWGAAATVLLGLAFGPALAGGSLALVFTTLAGGLLVMGFVYGPLGGWMPRLFPVTVRYTGMSVAFNVGGILGGAVAPIAAQMLSAAGGISLVGLFLSVAGLVTLLGVMVGRPSAGEG